MPLIPIILVALFLFPFSVEAKKREPALDDCLLTYLKGAKLDQVSTLISSSCKAIYKTPNFLKIEERAYNFCLLEHLKGVESAVAADTIILSCDNRHLRR